VIELQDLDFIYKLPIVCHEQGLDSAIIKAAGIEDAKPADLTVWEELVERRQSTEGTVNIAVVGKYVELEDAYKSVKEALTHAGIELKTEVKVTWVDSEMLEKDEDYVDLMSFNGILVPGGFGERGTRGMVEAVRMAREKDIPYFGICFGMHMAVLDGQRNVLNNPKAGSEEFDEGKKKPDYDHYIYHMAEWVEGKTLVQRTLDTEKGGSMRLGSFETHLQPGSVSADLYGSGVVHERHRHRYEVNSRYLDNIIESGLTMTGTSPDGKLPEIFEREDHPWFVGVQYHPELKSSPLKPHPLFLGFVEAAIKNERMI
jgi:CTP synthase